MDLHLVLDGSGPLRTQLERALRDEIRARRLGPGAALPPSRGLAAELGVSRGVVVEAYEQLTAEGYLVARVGAGTRVADIGGGAWRGRRGSRGLAPAGEAPAVLDLRPGLPDLASFPRRRWAAAVADALRELPDERLSYGDARGAIELREALAAYLGRVRGVSAAPEQVVITGGVRAGLALLWGALAAAGARRVGVERPGWPGQRESLEAAGLEPVDVAVDEDGLQVGELAASLARRRVRDAGEPVPQRRGAGAAAARGAGRLGALGRRADRGGRLRRPVPLRPRPVGSLAGLAPDRTVHAGSVSKLLAPGVAIGWLVLPGTLAGALVERKRMAEGAGSVIEQVALARLIAGGELDRHLRRTRRLYRRRRERVLAALARELPEARVTGAAAGLHVVLLLPAGGDEDAVVAAARRRGLGVQPLRGREPAVLLGYGRLGEESVDAVVRTLAEAVRGAACATGA